MDALHVRLIIEILGKPLEHVAATMNALVDRLSQEKGVTLAHKAIHEPRRVDESKALFTTFAEIELQIESIPVFFGIIFAYMPSNIEIISPTTFKIPNEEITSLANNLIGRLHLYESVTKKLVGDRDALINKLKSMGVTFQQTPPENQQSAPPTKKTKASPRKKSRKR